MADEAQETGGTTEETRPDWLPENFRTPEDLVKSYQEATRKISEQGTELSGYRQYGTPDDIDALLEAQQPAYQQPQNGALDLSTNPLYVMWERARETGDPQAEYAALAQLNQALLQAGMAAQTPATSNGDGQDYEVATNLAENNLRAKYGDEYDQLREQTVQYLQQNPRLLPRDDEPASLGDIQQGIETAFLLSRGGKLATEQQTLAQQQAEQETARRRKEAAQTLSGAGGHRTATTDEAKEEFDRIMAAGRPKTTFS